MKVRIVNWDSHQERADRGNFQWFKFYNKFWEDEKIHGLKPSTKLLFIYLLTLCSKASGDTVDFLPPIACALTGLGKFDLDELTAIGLIETPELPGKDRQEERRGEEKRYTCDLESLYQLYPKRPNQRKAFGMLRLSREMRTAEDYANLKLAVSNYAAHCKANKTEPQYTKQFGTFAGEWREWVDVEAVKKKGDWHG